MDTQVENLSNETPTPIARAIQNEINISPSQLSVKFAINNHLIDRGMAKTISEKPYDIVTGEIKWSKKRGDAILDPQTSNDLAFITSKKLIPDPKTGIGATREELEEHYQNLNKLIREGKLVIATDGIISYDNKPEKFEEAAFYLTFYGLIGIGSGVGIKTLRAIHSNIIDSQNPQISRRTFLNRTIYHSAGLLAVLKTFDLARGKEALIRLEKLLSNFDNPKFATFTEALITMRNRVMALNLWHELDRIDSENKKHINIYSYYGGAHKGIQTEFLKGPQGLKLEIESYIQRMFGPIFEQLLEEQNNDDVVVQQLSNFSEMFQDVYLLGKNSYLNSPNVNKNPSARTVLHTELDKVIKNSTDERKKRIFDRLKINITEADEQRAISLMEFNEKIGAFDNGSS